MVDIHKDTDPMKVAQQAGAAVADAVKKHMDKPVLLLLSGGSALKILEFLDPTSCGDCHVTVGMLDERVSTDAAVNNFAQLERTEFFKKFTIHGETFIDTKAKGGETPQELAARFEETLKNWKMAHADGMIIATMGIGEDGHVAGIMPYPDDERAFGFLFDDDSAWVVGYDAGTKSDFSQRATVTIPFLRMVDEAIIYVCGENKKRTLESVLAKKDELYKVPARVIHQMKHCLLYTDNDVGTV